MKSTQTFEMRSYPSKAIEEVRRKIQEAIGEYDDLYPYHGQETETKLVWPRLELLAQQRIFYKAERKEKKKCKTEEKLGKQYSRASAQLGQLKTELSRVIVSMSSHRKK